MQIINKVNKQTFPSSRIVRGPFLPKITLIELMIANSKLITVMHPITITHFSPATILNIDIILVTSCIPETCFSK